MSSVADLIDRHTRKIVESWLRLAEKAPAAHGLERAEVEDSMQEFLADLARRMRQAPVRPEQRGFFERHLGQRLRLGYTLTQLMNEYTLLWAAIATLWADDPSTRPAPAETERFFGVLNEIMTEVVDTFSTHLHDSAQVEKHAVRQLDKIAVRSLGESAATPTLRTHADEILQVIKNALEADHVAMATFDPTRRWLTVTAAVGLPVDLGAVCSVPLDDESLPGRVVASEEPVSLRYDDDAPPSQEPDQTLWRAGIRSVIGQRLHARDRLLGALCVGFRQRQAPRLWETRRLHTLAERVALLLDSGDTHQRLLEKNDELETTIERLHAERELRDRFVSVLAHDLRGPLSAAKLGTQMLLQLGAPPGVADVAARIERNIERTDRMIRDLLDANRVRAGERLALRIDHCDLVAITQDVVEELTALHGERFVILAPTAMEGYWSPEELRRTLWNLATNALKYGAPDRPITVTLTPEREHATLTVHNTGEPIPPPLQVQLFRAFARSASAQASGPRGWGLGLTLVLGCVEAHGGTVDVESSPEQGTTFTIRIPWDARPHQAPDGGLPADPPTR